MKPTPVALPPMRTEPVLTDLPRLPRPNLLFDAAELDALVAKRNDPRAEALLQETIQRCERYMDPKSEDYADWDTLKNPKWRKREGLAFVEATIEPCSFLWRVTNEERYAEFAKNVVFAILRHKLADQQYTRELAEFHTHEPYPGWRHSATHDFGNFSHALAMFYDLCGDRLTETERREFVAYAAENLTLALGMMSEVGRMGLNNRGARCAMGNAMLALAVYEEIDRELARYSIHKGMHLGEAWATFALDIDGASFEGASYCINTSVMLAGLGRACARRGLRDLSRHPNYRRLADFLLYNLAPTHDSFLPVNDCFRDLPPKGALVISTLHRDRVARWLYDELRAKLVMDSYARTAVAYHDFLYYDPTLEPQHPREADYPLAKHFRDRGVVSCLSRWEPDAAHFLFFCGPQVYGGHRQDDQNSFTFCALGEKFAWDGGYDHFAGVYEDRRYRRSEFHNTILIDGRGQIGYDNHHWPRGHIVDFRHCEDWTYALGDAHRCYGTDGVIARADRHVLFLRGEFPCVALVDDVIVDGDEHEVTWNFVAHPHTHLRQDKDGHWVVQAKNASMTIHVLGENTIRWQQDKGGTMPRFQATQRAQRVRFATVLLPHYPKLTLQHFEAAFEDNIATVTLNLNARRRIVTLDLRDRNRPIAGDEKPRLTIS